MKLDIVEFGSTNPNTLYLIHGWGVCSRIFYEIVPKLAKTFHVVCIDLPGYGINVNIPANRADGIILSLEETIKPNSAILGWSLGGLLALKYVILHPDNHSLITCSSSPRFTQDLNTKWPGIDKKLLDSLISLLTKKNANVIIDKFLTMQALGSKTMREDIKKIKSYLKEAPSPQFYELLAGLKTLIDEDLRASVSRITTPTLHLYGKNDRLTPPSQSYIWPHKNDTKIYIFDKSSHAPFISEPVEFVNIVTDFLTTYFF